MDYLHYMPLQHYAPARSAGFGLSFFGIIQGDPNDFCQNYTGSGEQNVRACVRVCAHPVAEKGSQSFSGVGVSQIATS